MCGRKGGEGGKSQLTCKVSMSQFGNGTCKSTTRVH